MTDTGILQMIVDISLIILGIYIAFFKSYFQEKGKNIATKEDIQEITTKVEFIKNEFLYSTQSKISLKVEERNSLVNCYEKFSHWLNTILYVQLAGLNDEAKEEIKTYKNQLYEAKHQFELASGRMALFVNNETLSNLLQQLYLKTFEIHSITNVFLYETELSMLGRRIARKKAMRLKTEEAIQDVQDVRRSYLDNLQKYNKDILEKYAVILPLDKDFRILANNHLRSLIENS